MSMETFICPKCKRQGCWTEEGEFDYVCKCGHSVQVEPELRDLSQADLIGKLYKVENERNLALMRIAELESHSAELARVQEQNRLLREALQHEADICDVCGGDGLAYATGVDMEQTACDRCGPIRAALAETKP